MKRYVIFCFSNFIHLLFTIRDAFVAWHITDTVEKHRNAIYLVFIAYYDSMVLFNMFSKGDDFPRIIEIALFFICNFPNQN